MDLVQAPLDFLGINYPVERLGVHNLNAADGPRTDLGWEVWLGALYHLLVRIAREY